MLGTSEKNHEWACQKEFLMFLELKNEPTNTFFNPNSSRFGKNSEMAFILTYNFANVKSFLETVLKENRIFKACSVYIQCPFFREIITAVSLIFYHLQAPFLVATGAETQYGHFVLSHADLLVFYPLWMKELKSLTKTPDPLLKPERLPYLKDFSHLCEINKKVYKCMFQDIFTGIDKSISEGTLDSDVIKSILTLFCEEFLIVLDRQVQQYYGSADSIVAEAVSQNPEVMKGVPTTSLAAEHSVGMLRSSFNMRKSAIMQTHSRYQQIMTSPLYHDVLKGKLTAESLANIYKQGRKSKTFKLYFTVKKSDKSVLRRDQEGALKDLQLKRQGKVDQKMQLAAVVKNHGGPCQTPEDVIKLCKRFKKDEAGLMRILWDEIKYQKYVIHSSYIADASLYLSKKWDAAARKYKDVSLEERIANLKKIVEPMTDETNFQVGSAENFIKLAKEKHEHMKLFPHRDPVSIDDDDPFYQDLPTLTHVAVYYNCADIANEEEHKWFPGIIRSVNISADCQQCLQFDIPECNNKYLYCFMVEFMEVVKTTKSKKISVDGNKHCSTASNDWELCNQAFYHVPVCQMIACKPDVVLNNFSAGGKAGSKREPRNTFRIGNIQAIEEAMHRNILYVLGTSISKSKSKRK
jgi:hypothetical protein